MCGRHTLTKPPEEVAAHFRLDDSPTLEPRYNVAPTQRVFALRAAGEGREGVFLRWGLVPSWASDPTTGGRMLNARAEAVREKPALRTAFLRRRCLIPTCGFYEWRVSGKKKLPVHFRMRDGRLFAFAGLWERWTSPSGIALESCSILTTAANELVRPIHDRLPAILDASRYSDWLDAKNADAGVLLALLAPWPVDEMIAVPANPLVNTCTLKAEFLHPAPSEHGAVRRQGPRHGGWDTTARLWDAGTGAPLGEPLPHDGVVLATAWSGDGRTLATGCMPGTGRGRRAAADAQDRGADRYDPGRGRGGDHPGPGKLEGAAHALGGIGDGVRHGEPMKFTGRGAAWLARASAGG
jgi:putative SOS response-associated peptidase YedK